MLIDGVDSSLSNQRRATNKAVVDAAAMWTQNSQAISAILGHPKFAISRSGNPG
jgi:hypothetical protein